MVNFYVARINSGKMTIKEVPSKWKSQVEDALNNVEGE